ncbi:MAG: NAD(P)H-hydrate dehydratase [Ruminococcus sp.]
MQVDLMEQTDRNIVKKAVFDRPDDANKGTLGSLLCICGCYGMAGAAVMAGKAALRCGLGLLKTALPKSIYPIAAGAIFESVFFPLEETPDGKISKNNIDFLLCEAEKSSAVLIGCGLSMCDDTKTLVNSFIENCTKPLVLDADALNCVAENPDILKKAKAPIIITPHPGEMARLLKSTPKAVNENRAEIATDFAKEYGVVTVLKGAGTVIASHDGRVMINRTGNSGMATGGSGDVLAGMTGSLLAQGAKPFDAAAAAVYLHGLAGDIAAEKLGRISMLPTDLINEIPQAYKRCGL